MKKLAAHDPVFWQRLERLRAVFLSRENSKGYDPQKPYWQSSEDLAAYDVSFARRIYQKWQFALENVPERAFPDLGWVDWGCGSGIASEAFLDSELSSGIKSLELFDHSPAAVEFAREKLANFKQGLNVRAQADAQFEGKGVLISHVLNEMSSSQMTVLHGKLKEAKALIWVESGSKPTSRKLSEVRDQLLKIAERDGDAWEILFPCPACEKCGILADDANKAHWCHFFAPSNRSWHQDSAWGEFAKKLKVDLRSLPLSALVLRRKSMVPSSDQIKDISDKADWGRIIGRPRPYKGYVKVLACSETRGVKEYIFEKKADKVIFKKLSKFSDKDSSLTRINWKLSPDDVKILSARLGNEGN